MRWLDGITNSLGMPGTTSATRSCAFEKCKSRLPARLTQSGPPGWEPQELLLLLEGEKTGYGYSYGCWTSQSIGIKAKINKWDLIKLLYNEVNYKQGEKTAFRVGEINSK